MSMMYGVPLVFEPAMGAARVISFMIFAPTPFPPQIMTPQLRGLLVTVEGSVQTFAVSTAWIVPAPALLHPVTLPLCAKSWFVKCWPSFPPAFPFKTPVKLLKSSVKMVVAPAVPLKQVRIPEA